MAGPCSWEGVSWFFSCAPPRRGSRVVTCLLLWAGVWAVGGVPRTGTQKKHGKKKTGKGAKDFNKKFLGDDLGGR